MSDWKKLPNLDEQASGGSWKDLPDVVQAATPKERTFTDFLKAKFFGPTEETPDIESLPGIRTIETPTGVTHLDAQGRQVLTPEESQQMSDAGGARFKQRVLEGGLSTLSGGGTMMDELAGLSAVGDPRSHPKGESAGDTYRRVRDTTRRDVGVATRNASPTMSAGGAELPVLPLVGAAAPSILAPLPLGALGRILSGGATSAIDQLGRSEADLTRGQGSEFGGDVAGAGVLGLGLSGLAEGITAPMRLIGKGATTRAAEAAEVAKAANAKAAAKALKSAQGTAGGVTSGGINSLEWLDDVLANPSNYTAADLARAQAASANPELATIRSAALQGNLEKLDRFLPAIDDARVGMEQAAQAATPEAVAAKTARQLDPSTAMSDWGSRAWDSVGQRAVGSAVGGALGSGVDAVMGNQDHQGGLMGIGAGVFAAPGMIQFMRNTAKSPVMQNMAARGLAGAADASSSTMNRAARTASPISSVAAESQAKEAQLNAFEALAKRFGINAKSKDELASEAFVRGQTGGL